jgi:hypothetical protein
MVIFLKDKGIMKAHDIKGVMIHREQCSEWPWSRAEDMNLMVVVVNITGIGEISSCAASSRVKIVWSVNVARVKIAENNVLVIMRKTL